MTSPAGSVTTDYGRTYTVQGHVLPSVSTITKVLHAEGLQVWKQKRIAEAVALDPHLRALVETGDTYRAVRSALDTQDRTPSEIGTDVHALTEAYDRGEDYRKVATVHPLHLLEPFAERWMETRADCGIEIVEIERTVADLAYLYAGTFDRLVTIEVNRCCDLAHVLDIKTGSVYGSVALQLAAYALAPSIWLPDTDELIDKPPTCRTTGYVADLKADRCRIIPVELIDACNAIRATRTLWYWSTIENSVLGDPLPKQAGALPW